MKNEKYTFKEGDVYLSSYGDKEYINDRLIGHKEGDWLNMTLHKKEEDIKKYFSVGDRIEGFCNGFFSRDDYDNKVCVGVFYQFAVFQYENGEGVVLNFAFEEKEKKNFWSMVECWRCL